MLILQKQNKDLPSFDEWSEFIRNEFSEDANFTEKCLNYIEPLTRNRLPIIFDGNHLSKLLGVSGVLLLRMSIAPSNFYRVFEIPKKSGGVRIISTPHKSLKLIQGWILENILYRLKISSAATGFVINKSIVDHLRPHVGQGRYLWVSDIKDFFPSITKKRVIGFFRSLGYNNEVSLMLGSLCCLDGCLPQGAPTSPAISNIITRKFDEYLLNIFEKNGVHYTRYADDICISAIHDRIDVFENVSMIMKMNNFTENIKKRNFFSNKSLDKIVMGINISSNEMKLTKNFKNFIRKEIYFINKFGYDEHFNKKGVDEVVGVMRLIGIISYALMIEQNNKDYRIFKYNLMLRSLRYR